METKIGFVLVSKTISNQYHDCLDCKSHPKGNCPGPSWPIGSPLCVPSRQPDQSEYVAYRRQLDSWRQKHYSEVSTGGTRLGPLHYFSDCNTLLKRGPRRQDAKIVALDVETASALDLPLCKECKAKMAPFEEQIQVLAERQAAK